MQVRTQQSVTSLKQCGLLVRSMGTVWLSRKTQLQAVRADIPFLKIDATDTPADPSTSS